MSLFLLVYLSPGVYPCMQACAEGPRATEQFAAVAAAFVSGLCGSAKAQDLAANFVAALAARLERAMNVKDRCGTDRLLL